MNNRGDIPTLLVFVVALSLIGISLFGFAVFYNNLGWEIGDFSKMISEVRFYEQYIVKSVEVIGRDVVLQSVMGSNYGIHWDVKESFIRLANEFAPFGSGVRINGVNGFFDRIEKGDFEFNVNSEGQYVFEMKGLVIKVEKGINSFSRKLDARVVFDKDGKIVGA